MREPCAAGILYHSDFSRLDTQIRECFEGERGPGELPLSRRKGIIRGVIVPSGKYTVSGSCAAWVYKELGESVFPKTFVILCGSKTVSKSVYVTQQNWMTPFGMVRSDKELINDLVSKGLVVENDSRFKLDYSVEVQLPFLQFVSRSYLDKLRIVPLIVGSYSQDLVDYFIDSDVCFVLSSDLTRFGPKFRYTPFVTGIKQKMDELDGLLISGILKGDLSFRNRSFIGFEALKVVMAVCKWHGCRSYLVHYYNSGDVTGDYRNVIGYGGFVFR